MHAGAVGRSREERVAQVRADTDGTTRGYATYVPTESAVSKLVAWRDQGAEIDYLSSHRELEHVEADAKVLQAHAFPQGQIFYRRRGETYGDVVARIRPDILIEDDCESVGAGELTYPKVSVGLRERMISIIVPEFGGLGHLPDSIADLAARSRRF
jgi:hypothetical protein